MSYKWYVVITSANRENETAKILDKYDLVSYNPQVKVPSNIKDQDIFKPLFPGYLFAHTKYKNMKLPSISQINGIYGWLKFNDDLPYIEDSVISEIKRTLFNINSSYGLWSDFKPGEKVMVEAGKISEYAEIIENAKSPHENVKVLMHFMGRKIPALVPWHNIKPIKSSNKKNTRLTRGRGRKIRNIDPNSTKSLVLQK